ncbi:S-adenosyl-L-methionine-dependent methyltransferase [Pseudomassariella vexata]|uniref:S-adenosyl-L-methionine-dependent methyltransferase n=1 Tax=Pseudomassariella vexata TaxID=1141098 RepID=A0A1Y2EDI8_9PEZI|nr:S-adenosyl-L-methionine-dependent methyltransferase [Pseudomassariella vexata]ORY69638.1 S-adenosyl-L-methionine-dependent methyltransferase [Pseudomassariella vexata]
MASNNRLFAQDPKFWSNYLKGRPRAPDSFFDRIFAYHAAQGGRFSTAHDIGAGNGPYAQKLRAKFSHVIISDIVAANVELAQGRLGIDGYSYRAAKVEEVDDIPEGSVDMVFATNVMHFPDQEAAMGAVAKQLRSGGTFACGAFGPARFHNEKLQDLWERISHQGGRVLLKKAERPAETARIMARTQDSYNVAPLDSGLFLPGARRVHLNMGKGGIIGILPPEEAYRNTEPDYTGPEDVEVFEDEEGWGFEMDLDGVKEHIGSFPFVAENTAAFTEMFRELEDLLRDGKLVRGYWPAKVILATRR